MRRNLNLWPLIGLCLVALSLVVACNTPRPPKPFSIDPNLVMLPAQEAADDVGAIESHTDAAENAVKAARQAASQPALVKPILDLASDQHAEVIKHAAGAKTEIHQAMVEKTQADAAAIKATGERDKVIGEWGDKYAGLEAKWYVRWGRFIERMLWIIGIAWMALGVLSVVCGLGNPLGWAFTLSRELVRLIPAMNLFAWVRDAINHFRGTGTAS